MVCLQEAWEEGFKPKFFLYRKLNNVIELHTHLKIKIKILILVHQCILILPKKKKKFYSQKIIRTSYKNDMVVGFPKTIPGFGDHCSS